jgi:thiol-disulfide isomerase/thioredoxin
MSENATEKNDNLWTPGRIIATVVVVALIATIGYTLLGGHTEVDNNPGIVLPGTPVSDPGSKTVPADFEVRTMDGRTIKLSEFRGKVVVLDFWATWCPPCREGTPQLVRIANQNRARGVEVIGMHIDDRGRSTPEDIKKFMNQYSIPYTIALATDEMFVAYLGTEETAIPQTLVFDRSGRAVAHLVGYNQSHARTLDEAVNRALAGS